MVDKMIKSKCNDKLCYDRWHGMLIAANYKMKT